MTSPNRAAPEGGFAPMGKAPLQPYGVPDSRFWFSDREIGSQRPFSAVYTSEDFRRELIRVEKKYYRFTLACIVVAVIAIAAIIGVIIQVGWGAL